MKKILFLPKQAWLILYFLLLATSSMAQQTSQKNDKVHLLNGEIKEGKIQAISDDAIQFSYAGETLNYNLKKNAIHKLEFASGREEVLNQNIIKPVASTNYLEKSVAILPLFYIGEGTDKKTDEMRYRLQKETYNFMSKKARELKFQDPSETNALLFKNKVNEETIRQYTIGELAAILQVEYVITGTVTQEIGNSSQYTNSTSSGNTQIDADRNRQINVKEKNQTISHTSNNVDIKTSVDLSVFNIKGEKIYNDTKKSVLTTVDAYKNSLHYLLKRTPLYER